MNLDEQKDTPASSAENGSGERPDAGANGSSADPGPPAETTETPAPPAEDTYPYEDSYGDEGSSYEPPAPAVVESAPVTAPAVVEKAPPAVAAGGKGGARPPTTTERDEGDDEEEHMLRMSFLEHLEELRARLIRSVAGVVVAFVLGLTFANQLWLIITEPAADALTQLGVKDPRLAQITPMEAFTTVWIKLPMLTAVFLASPWLLYQLWAFISPGLYRRERRWAGPFILCSAGLFITGGLFAYYVIFRFGLVFLLGIGRDIRIQPLVSVTEYFDLFVNVTLGVGIVFEMPVLIFLLTLLRVLSPRFLIRHSRYAILVIVTLAAVITPTPDVFNLMLFSVPMIVLYFVGVFASYILVLHREHQRFPWKLVVYAALALLVVLAGLVWLAVARYGFHFHTAWPFLTR